MRPTDRAYAGNAAHEQVLQCPRWKERTPYNETGDMWGVSRTDPSAPKVLVPYKESGHMIRSNNVEILTLAEEAAFLYWLTEEEKYASFAADIFNTWLVGTYYMNPILDPRYSFETKKGYNWSGVWGTSRGYRLFSNRGACPEIYYLRVL